ncbi:MAG TPA: metallophosphoesterase family protein [Opitutaceae bacterium]|nr:metallophosphoesterase family protein [Opitutaceae bacterium]
MNATELAVIADVHGNAWALEAVLSDIARRGVKPILNLGDNANGPLDPRRSVELLRGCGAIHVRGNGDRMTGEGGATARRSAHFARERLDAEALRWLRELPAVVRGEDWIAFHATPRSDEEYFLENVVAGKTALASVPEIAARLGDTAESLVLCGHTHLPRVVRLDDARLVVNPGSVGLPAYEDDLPVPHVVENGSPDARYAIVRRDSKGWSAELIGVPYDWRAAGAAARAAGWPDWARSVETGAA